jgi:hypothetical protein
MPRHVNEITRPGRGSLALGVPFPLPSTLYRKKPRPEAGQRRRSEARCVDEKRTTQAQLGSERRGGRVRMLGSAGPVFSVGGRSFDRGDVFVSAVLRGEWTELKERLRSGIACVRQASDEGREASGTDLEAAAQEFRYARNLITAQETEAWLERVGLDFEDWAAHLERSLLRDAAGGAIADIAARYPVPEEELHDQLYAEAVCSGALERFADALAGRAAIFERALLAGPAGREPERARVSEAAREVERTFGPGEPLAGEWTARIAALARIEAAFQGFAQQAANPSAVRAQIHHRRLEWIRVDWRRISLPEEQAAREAALCLRDGEPLDEVAARAGLSVRQEAVLLAEIDARARAAVLGARPGDLVGPLAVEGGFLLALVEAKRAPSEADAEVRRRAEAEVVAALVAEAKKQVRWHAPF